MLTIQSSINFPSKLRIEGKFVDVEAVCGAWRSGVFHSVPRCKKVLSFDSHQVARPLCFVRLHKGITKHQAFTTITDDCISKDGRFIAVADNTTLRSQHNSIAVSIGILHPLQPVAFDVRIIKRNEAASIGEQSMPHGNHGLDVFATTAPDFAVKRNAARKLVCEAGRSFDDVTVTSPKLVAVPESPASVKLLAPEIPGAVPEIPIPSESHVCFVHSDKLAGLNKNATYFYAR